MQSANGCGHGLDIRVPLDQDALIAAGQQEARNHEVHQAPQPHVLQRQALRDQVMGVKTNPKGARSVECRCDPSFTCGYCLRNAKPWHWTPSTEADRQRSRPS